MTDWKTLDIAPKYQINIQGDVKSSIANRLLRQHDNGSGYLFVVMKHDGKRLTKYAHRLVAEYFCDQPMIGQYQVNHIDGNKKNNHASNLEYCTPLENTQHAKSIGRATIGNRRIPISGIIEIFSCKRRENNIFLAEKYGVGERAIRDIKAGRTNEQHTKSYRL
jgi:HNH endonuclease